jgi:hypothetical protein
MRRFVPHVVVATVMVVLAAPAAATPVAVAGGRPVSPPAKAVKACATPLGVTVDAAGEQHHRFQLTPTLIEDHVVPGADFDPLTASTDRLRKLGLPPRPPAGDPEEAQWRAVATSLQRRAAPKPGCLRPHIQATFHTLNYSGYRAIAETGKTYSGAHSSYTAPSYYLSTCTSESMTQWVGVSDNTNLVQAGVYVSQYTGTVESGGFYEIVGGSWDTGGLIDVSASVPYIEGHRYYFNVQYVDRYTWAFLVNDLTNGNVFSINIFHPGGGGTQYRRPLGYFTSERLTYFNPVTGERFLTQYMNHSLVRLRTATVHVYNEGEALLSSQRPEQVIGHSPGINGPRIGNIDPIEVGPSNFSEHWARCGQVE